MWLWWAWRLRLRSDPAVEGLLLANLRALTPRMLLPQVLLEDAADHPATPWHSLEVLTFAGRTEILQQLNATEAVYAKDVCRCCRRPTHPPRSATCRMLPDRLTRVFVSHCRCV